MMKSEMRAMGKKQISIFRARESADLTPEHMPNGAMRPADETGLAAAFGVGISDSALVRLLFEDKESRTSLVYAWFKSNAMLPRHAHSADCVYYIISGSLRLGSEELGPGDGFMVPADALYTYVAGPGGLEILEFRTATEFDISYSGTEASWERIVESVKVNRPDWLKMAAPPTAQRMLARDDNSV